jgi:hypothetical protein
LFEGSGVVDIRVARDGMADSARTHTQASLRATKKKAKNDGERKVVFKSVLDNPFRIKWYVIRIVNMASNMVAGHPYRSTYRI